LKMLVVDAFGISLLYILPQSIWTVILSSFVCGFAWGQMGWLQHDFGHNSVFKTPYQNRLGQVFASNFMIGGSADWWNGRHNRHHADPNRVEVIRFCVVPPS
jgi:fatty acid desaturase 2 (delta-6 desaturase)